MTRRTIPLKYKKRHLLSTLAKDVPQCYRDKYAKNLEKYKGFSTIKLESKLRELRIELIIRRRKIRNVTTAYDLKAMTCGYFGKILIIDRIVNELKNRDGVSEDLYCHEEMDHSDRDDDTEDDNVDVEDTKKLSFAENILYSLDDESLEDILFERFAEDLEDKNRKLTPEEQAVMNVDLDNISELSDNDMSRLKCIDCNKELILFEKENEAMCDNCFTTYFDKLPNIDDVEVGKFLMEAFPIQPIPEIPFETSFPTVIQPEPILEIPDDLIDKPQYFCPTCAVCEMGINTNSPDPSLCVWCYYALFDGIDTVSV